MSGHRTIELNIAGVICHSLSHPLLLLHLGQWKKGANLLCTIQYQTIRAVRSASSAPVLYVQADNSASENKNRYMFALYAMLVEFGWFKQIEVHMMVVGHTHGPIDQFFSVLQRGIANRSVPSVPALVRDLPKIYKDEKRMPTPVWLDTVYDWVSYFDCVLHPMFHHTRPHSFLFKLNADGEACMFSRDRADQAWTGVDGTVEGLPLFARSLSGAPKLLSPDSARVQLPASTIKAIEGTEHMMSSSDFQWVMSVAAKSAVDVGSLVPLGAAFTGCIPISQQFSPALGCVVLRALSSPLHEIAGAPQSNAVNSQLEPAIEAVRSVVTQSRATARSNAKPRKSRSTAAPPAPFAEIMETPVADSAAPVLVSTSLYQREKIHIFALCLDACSIWFCMWRLPAAHRFLSKARSA